MKFEAKPTAHRGAVLSKYSDLILGTFSICSAAAILFFFTHFGFNPLNGRNMIAIKPGYSQWAWLMFSFSSAIYYFVRSSGASTTGGYTNTTFKRLISIAEIIPFFGLVLSWTGSRDIFTNIMLKNLENTTSQFLDSLLILFVFAHFGAGIALLRSHTKNKQS